MMTLVLIPFIQRIQNILHVQKGNYTSVAEPKLFIFGSGSFLAPPLSIILAPAPAPAKAIYSHFKLFYNSSTGTILIEVEMSFSSS